ncbi:phosphoribosylaminoimidazole carboxylase [Annulohypoxylon maeteangense]|uniref:phosphoribosylaminoimidazole carboxylase n=1 Tax=Annulohypoxylon maeteangense TaxID=1927788 RepID=UPI00200775BE|nr:phosphoribosylaminoimidazole carboxylase [Annulohypoxylon maeteangense]KAI0889398.1 phosphoribosylaminoimidazole carboxylase [Annulohypoxylon maeteangense]
MAAKKPVIGLLGGGQLGRMLCEAAGPLGIPIAILDAENCPAKQVNQSDLHVTGSFKDPEKIKLLATRCDFLTVEIEHVETEVLEEIATKGVEIPNPDGEGTILKKVPVHPSWKTIRLIQDKYQQKEYFAKNGIPVTEQMAIESGETKQDSLDEAAWKYGFPFMLKGSKGSYDGRGNFKVSGPEDLKNVSAQMGDQALYAEKWVPFEMELSVMVLRTEDDNGKLKHVYPYPVVETIHEDSICTKVFYPPRSIPEDVKRRAQKVASDVIASLWGRGVFAVEMFLLADGQILVNEVAPRPHNSGHFTIEAVPQMSQYKAQLYSILDRVPDKGVNLTARVPSSIMLNVLGGAQPSSHDKYIDLAEEAYDDFTDIYVHLYGKESKPGRKIGHITATGFSSVERLAETISPLIKVMDEIRAERIGSKDPIKTQTTVSKPVPLVAVTMGSDSDLTTVAAGLKMLDAFKVPYEVRITSAHRTPHLMMKFAAEMAKSGCKVIIAAAGGAAHLPGMLASEVHIPVIGIPVKASVLDGVDSLHSIVQMPRGIPCATVGIGNSTNAALLAIRILGGAYPEYAERMKRYQESMKNEVLAKDERISSVGWKAYLDDMQKK